MVKPRPFRNTSRGTPCEDVDEQGQFPSISRNCQNHSHCSNLKLQTSTRLLADFSMSYEISLIQPSPQTSQGGNLGVKNSQNIVA